MAPVQEPLSRRLSGAGTEQTIPCWIGPLYTSGILGHMLDTRREDSTLQVLISTLLAAKFLSIVT